jgi:hypothetical protein
LAYAISHGRRSGCPRRSQLTSDSAGMPNPSCSRQIILSVSERLRFSTSCTRLRLPMKGMRSRGCSPFWSMWYLIASTGSAGGFAWRSLSKSSDSQSVNVIAFSVRADKLHKRNLPTEVECGDQPVVSTSNFEAGTITIKGPWIFGAARRISSIEVQFAALTTRYVQVRPLFRDACGHELPERFERLPALM